MDAESFTFSLSVPRESQFVSTVRGLAVHAARYASCDAADAERFGGAVEKAVHACLRDGPSAPSISVVVSRHDAGALEVRVDGRAITVEP